MNQLTQYLVEGILNEDKKEVVALYAGGFKPPTAGHFTVVEEALKQYPEIDKLIVLVGSGIRDGIEQAESILVWEIYQNYLPMKVEIQAATKPPIRAVYSYAGDNPDDTIYWILGARDGKDEDLSDIATRTAAIDKAEDKYNNVEVKIITTSDAGMSGTNARKALQAGNREAFDQFIPSQVEEKDEIFNILKPAVKENIPNAEDNGKAAPFGSGYKPLNEHSMGNSIDILPKLAELTQHMIDKGYNIEPLPGLELIDDDVTNAEDFFGKTAYYDPNTQTIVLYTHGRHPKDIARSFAHEMIHHIQNLEGRLGNITTTNTQEDDHLNDIEAEANLKGTMTFRNWTDGLNENKQINYTTPNFNTEWEEAIRYPEFKEMGKDGWLKIANQGKPVSYSSIKDKLGNVDLDFEGLEEPKKQRFLDAFKKGTIEMPIAVKFSDSDYDLVAGNTRLSGLVKNGIDSKIWIVDISNTQENLNEIGDLSQPPYKWETFTKPEGSDDPYSYYDFSTDNGVKYQVVFNREEFGKTVNYDMTFVAKGKDGEEFSTDILTGGNEPLKIMSTIVDITRDQIKKAGDVEFITFKPTKGKTGEEGAKGNPRSKLYKIIIKKNFPKAKVSGTDTVVVDMTAYKSNGLNEIGDASAAKLEWRPSRIDVIAREIERKIRRQEDDTVEYYDMLPAIEVISYESRTRYRVTVDASVDKPEDELAITTLRVDFTTEEGGDDAINKGEQYKILATLTDIIIQLINRVNEIDSTTLDLVKFYAKDDTEGKYSKSDSKRGKLYQAFINKNLSKLPGDWKMSTSDEVIMLSPVVNEGFNKNLGKDPFGLNQFARELMAEGAYDSLTTKLTKATINKWVEDSKKKPMPKKSFVDIDVDEVDGKGREIEFNYVGLVEFDKKVDGYEVDGTSNAGEDEGKFPFIATLFKINPKVLPQAWSKISADVSDVIRHEIEHLTQTGDNLRTGKYMDDDIQLRDLINKAKILPQSDYYKLEKEVDAMLQGLYLKAKKTKKPFKDVIKNYLDIAPGLEAKEDKEIILNLWRSRRGALSLPVFENEEKVMDYKIFLDMDGVLVNFDEQFKELTGQYPKDYESTHSSDEFWGEIDGAGVGFWRGMKWMPGGEALYNRASQFDHVLLSSPSRSEVSKIGKRLWRRDKTPNTKLILARSYNKRKYAAPNHILIDDREDNIQQWRDAGGIGILYKSAEQVNTELDKLGL